MDSENPDKKTGEPQAGPTIPQIEERITEFWEKDGTFEKSLEKTKDGTPYTFYDGPPFANGLPHYGHILASTIKDLIPRYQTMRGRYVRRRWGWDCHGLPVEALVEKELGISGKKQIEEIGIKAFNEACRSSVLKYVDEWRAMVRRMGRWVDFENSYKTMDLDYMESVWWAFKQVYDKDLAYEGRKVLLYCPRCETPISNFEVAMDNSYKDVTDESVFVKFKTKADPKTFLLAWTTTPWTLPGNVALAVGKDIEYIYVDIGGERLIVAKALADKIFPSGYAVYGAPTKGAALVGLAYEPLFDVPEVSSSDKAHKVYAADFVTTEDGTGIVHTAVVYGEDDYKLGLQEGLPIVPLLDEKGHFNEQAPELIRGQYFKKAEKIIKEDLESRKPSNLIFKREAYTHPYPHCWRCNTALYYNAIPAWFINIQKIKKDLLKSNEDQINWFPEHLKHGRYQKSVEAAPDWNISRNRYWGNPIPVWKCEECHKNTAVGSLADLGARSVKAKNRYIILRHGESENFVQNINSSNPETQGAYDLTAEGIAHVERTANELKDEKIDMIYASDFKRTTHTAQLVAKALGISEVVPEKRLREINTAAYDGKPIREYVQLFANRAERFVKAPEGGETMSDVMSRVWSFLQDMEKQYEGKTILLVSHDDVLWATEGVMRGWDVKKIIVAKPKGSAFIMPGDFHKVELEPLPRNDKGLVDLHRPYIDEVVLKCDCGGNMRRTPEIFDSWVEAGSMPFSEYHYPFENKELFESRFPAQFVVEYIAQTRAWFYVMHVMSQIVFGKAPFQNVVTTGTILAEDGSKMSKSKNNYPDPWLIIDKYGVDTLRFYLASSVVMDADNLSFSEKDLESVHRKVTMILWNVQQYFVTYTKQSGWQAGSDDVAAAHVLDRWITARAKELIASATEHLDSYDTIRTARAISEFVDDLSTWYLRRSRGREDASFFPTFRKTLVTVSQVIAPFMPHIAEAVYKNARSEQDAESVHLTDWPVIGTLTDEEKKLLEDMATVRRVASVGLALRKSENLPVRQPLASMQVLIANGQDVYLPEALVDILLSELNVKKIETIGDGLGAVSSLGEASDNLVVRFDTNLTGELKMEGEIRKLERAIQGKRKEMGMKVGEMARLTYNPSNEDEDKAFAAIDAKKTYISEIKKGAASDGTFELEKVG
jgi:isoleucyl-tRNA synthetase